MKSIFLALIASVVLISNALALPLAGEKPTSSVDHGRTGHGRSLLYGKWYLDDEELILRMTENTYHDLGLMLKKFGDWKGLDNTLVIFIPDKGGPCLSGTFKRKPVRHFNAILRGEKVMLRGR